jgi:hypothetical protein
MVLVNVENTAFFKIWYAHASVRQIAEISAFGEESVIILRNYYRIVAMGDLPPI